MITPNQYDELTLFLMCEELSRKTSLVDMSAFDMDSFLQGFHLYFFDNCDANTYIQNDIKDNALPKYDRTNMCFVLINEKEESSKVSSIVSISKPGYVEKLPFKPLPPKEGKNKKKKKKSKRIEETISSPKHVAPIIVFDESELDDIPMPVTYSSDHEWEKHTTFDIKNLLIPIFRLIIFVPLFLSMFLPMMICLHMNTLWKIAILFLMMITMMSMIFLVHLLLRRKQGMITICLLFLMIILMRIIILLNLLLLRFLRMIMFMLGVLILLCIWLMIRMFYVIVILLILFMMLLKVIMREGKMVLCISILLSFPSFCWNS
jgi:hypothetical protein